MKKKIQSLLDLTLTLFTSQDEHYRFSGTEPCEGSIDYKKKNMGKKELAYFELIAYSRCFPDTTGLWS